MTGLQRGGHDESTAVQYPRSGSHADDPCYAGALGPVAQRIGLIDELAKVPIDQRTQEHAPQSMWTSSWSLSWAAVPISRTSVVEMCWPKMHIRLRASNDA